MSAGIQLAKAEAAKRRALLRRTPIQTSAKFFFAFFWIVGSLILVWFRNALKLPTACLWTMLSIICVLQCLMFAHFTELQHELLHGHGFTSNKINRTFGFFCGIPMISSYTHYRYSHLIHHRKLGTEQNSEFFIYPKRGLNSPLKLLLAALDPSRFARVGGLMYDCMKGNLVPDILDGTQSSQAMEEYAAYGWFVLAAATYTMVSRDISLIIGWALPLFLIAEPVHYLLELPEHFGLDANGDTRIEKKTRRIQGSWLSTWYTNGNNVHTAHHFMEAVPMSRIKQLNEACKDKCDVFEDTYWSFYIKVISGELVPFENGRNTINA